MLPQLTLEVAVRIRPDVSDTTEIVFTAAVVPADLTDPATVVTPIEIPIAFYVSRLYIYNCPVSEITLK